MYPYVVIEHGAYEQLQKIHYAIREIYVYIHHFETYNWDGFVGAFDDFKHDILLYCIEFAEKIAQLIYISSTSINTLQTLLLWVISLMAFQLALGIVLIFAVAWGNRS